MLNVGRSPFFLSPSHLVTCSPCHRTARLYEQGAPPERIGNYVRRWLQWVRAGLEGYVPVTLGDVGVVVAMLPRLPGP